MITAAELLAEIGDCRARYPSRDALAGDAGQAAVALESGKRKTASFRWAATSGCVRRSARWPTAPATGTPGAGSDAAAIARGHEHPRAIRTLGRLLGAASCGSAGRSAPRMTRPATAPCNGNHGHHPHRVGPVVDEVATLRMAADAIATNPRPDSRVTARTNFFALDGGPWQPRRPSTNYTAWTAQPHGGAGRGRCRFAPAEPPGGLSLWACAQRAICVRGCQGDPGMCPRPTFGLRQALPGNQSPS